MASEISRLQQMLQNSWDGNMWHGTNLKQVLEGIDFGKAFRKPTAGSHNIYELLMHMHCWRKFTVEQLKGNSSYQVELNSETDWPVKYEQTEASWKTGLALFKKSQEEIMASFSNLKEEMLDEMVPGRKFTWYALIHGLIHHDIYHSGQISILKK